MSTARVDFTRAAAERIARVVRIVEGGDRSQSGPTFGRIAESTGGGGKVFRVCTFTGSWSIDTSKVITFRGVTTTPNTVLAHNLFAELVGITATAVPCAIAKDGSTWYLVAARCS